MGPLMAEATHLTRPPHWVSLLFLSARFVLNKGKLESKIATYNRFLF